MFHIDGEFPLGKLERLGFALTPSLDFEKVGQRVDRLDADAIQANGFFESLAVILGAGVDLRGAVEEFP